jgi:adenine deaminase
MKISGNLIDLHSRYIYGVEMEISAGIVKAIKRMDEVPARYILPGLVDAHMHVESSMVTPSSFVCEAVRHGTVAAVADPHEIANVLGTEGIRFMIEDAKTVPFRFMFGAPSCVPATPFESSGALIDSKQTAELLALPQIGFLSEMMNFPGLLSGDDEILKKIDAAKRMGKPVDGHAPGLTGTDLRKYVNSGITTDHECETEREAIEKIEAGMKVLIREGSAAKNLEALHSLVSRMPQRVMLCSDDIHPDDLLNGHINLLVKRLLGLGHNLFDVLAAASINPIRHYNLPAGMLRVGDNADFIIIDHPDSFEILETWIGGSKVFDGEKVTINSSGVKPVNRFNCSSITRNDIKTDVNDCLIRVIEAFDGLLYTGSLQTTAAMPSFDVFDTANDILKIVVKERYNDRAPACAFIKGFGLSKGAMASSVAHDSHNIVAVGTDDDSIVRAVNRVIEMKGGLSWCGPEEEVSLQLDIGGIMSGGTVAEAAAGYRKLTDIVRKNGSALKAPFMTLSFMSLLVIPELKIGDRGLFDVNRFEPVPVLV